jgi:hypothetical protein
MRFDGFINEGKKEDKINQQLRAVVKKCSQFFDELSATRNPFIYRGTRQEISGIVEARIPRKDRKPKDTDIFIHEIMFKCKYYYLIDNDFSQGIDIDDMLKMIIRERKSW